MEGAETEHVKFKITNRSAFLLVWFCYHFGMCFCLCGGFQGSYALFSSVVLRFRDMIHLKYGVET